MVYSHWGLNGSPFANQSGTRGFFQSANHEEVLARLHFLVEQNRRVGLLLGENGVGKSLMLDVFAQQKATPSLRTVRLALLGVTLPELLWQTATQLGSALEPTESPFALWNAVTEQLLECRYQHTGVLMLLDDADEARADVLEQVARIAQLDVSSPMRLSIVLAGQSRRISHFGRRLLELADLRVDLEPWLEPDTAEYVRWALAAAGCTRPVFTNEALRHLHHLTDGVPRRVKQLADMTLLAGAGAELEQIDVDVLDSVYHELGVAVMAR